MQLTFHTITTHYMLGNDLLCKTILYANTTPFFILNYIELAHSFLKVVHRKCGQNNKIVVSFSYMEKPVMLL